jgi:phage terminase large subunit GpA-like protein
MNAAERTIRRALKELAPGEPLTPAQWCEKNLVLSRGSSSKVGRFTPFPWQVDPLNSCLTHGSTVLCWPAQLLGKTMTLLGVLGYQIACSPCAMLFIFPTVEAGEIFSKTKLGPILSDTPALAKLVYEDAVRSRRKGSGAETVSLKRYSGGHLILAGANAPSGLRSHSTRVQFFDEISAYPQSVGNEEGDPIAIATKRAETFPDSFQMMTSTPTILGQCRVTMEMAESSYSRWNVVCPGCKMEWVMMWANVRWPKHKDAASKTVHDTSETYIECPHCGLHIDDETRQQISLAGRWVATRPEITHRAGFWSNALICCLPPARGFKNRLHQWADEFLRAERRGSYFMRTFQTTVLAEPYQLVETVANFDHLYARREVYRESKDHELILDKACLLLTVGADVHRDRIHGECLASCMDGETFGVEYQIFYGNTELLKGPASPWPAFDSWCQKRYRHESGHWLNGAVCVCIDAKHKTESVYRYVRSCNRMVFSIRGERGFAAVGESATKKSEGDNPRLWRVKVDGIKESIYSRLQIEEPGPGYQHFPSNSHSHYDERYFKELTCEVLKTSPSGAQYYDKPTSATRNEAVDTRCYAEAAVAILNPRWHKVKEKLDAPPENDWREQEDERKRLISLPIPDLRGVTVPEKDDLDESMRAFVNNNPALKKWCTW